MRVACEGVSEVCSRKGDGTGGIAHCSRTAYRFTAAAITMRLAPQGAPQAGRM